MSGVLAVAAGLGAARATEGTVAPSPAVWSPARSAGKTLKGEPRSERSGAEIFATHCAACHGAEGRGAPATEVGFELELPDFTDCSFGNREPESDWYAVAREGGPARAFDRTMPAFGELLSEAEMRGAVRHLRTFCDEPRRWPRGELNVARAIVTSKAFPEDELTLGGRATLEGPTDVAATLIYGQRLGARYQVELSLPFGFREATDAAGERRWAFGAGDIGIGLKRVLLHSLSSGTIVTLAAEGFVPTGDEADGYGRGTPLFEPFLAGAQLIPKVGFVQLQAGLELPVGRDVAEPEAFGRLALGRTFAQRGVGRVWSPQFEVLAARRLGAGERVSFDYLPQLQVALSRRQHVLGSLGVRMPLTELDERPTEVLFYVLWDWFDGGLGEGW